MKKQTPIDSDENLRIILAVIVGIILAGGIRAIFPGSKRILPLFSAIGGILSQQKRDLANLFAGMALPGLYDYAVSFTRSASNQKELGRGRPPRPRPKSFDYEVKEIEVNGETVKLKYTPWFDPFSPDGEDTNAYLFTDQKKGIYFIREDKSEEITYIGFSNSDILKAMYRHFYPYADSGTQYRVTYPKTGYEVQLVLSDHPNTGLIEKALIQELQPRHNHEIYNGLFTQTSAEATETRDDETEVLTPRDVEAPF